MSQGRQEKEVAMLREVMQPPSTFEEGFSGKTIIGAIFLGLFMLPGSMYLMLFMGAGLGPAARWVTVILFAEVARRSLKSLRQQEVFILFYMTGIALATPFQGLLWNQYLVQSDVAQALGIASEIPKWSAPSAQNIRETAARVGHNTFFTKFWLYPILLISFQLLITRVNGFGLGYALYRLTAHGERLPFPMAPVDAQGVVVLSEDREQRTRGRWTVFAIGGMIGIVFGLIYIGLPSFTGSFLGTPYRLLPIPWLDLTAKTEKFLPATPLNIVFDLTLVVTGMVLPFWAVVGGLLGVITMIIMNPMLQKGGMLNSWQPGMGLVDTLYFNNLDFYLSFSIGLAFAVFLISLGTTVGPLLKRWLTNPKHGAVSEERHSLLDAFRYDRMRGDIPVWISIAIYVFSTIGYILLCRWMINSVSVGEHDRFPTMFFLIFAFIYTPLISYVSAKLEGLVGQTVPLPLVNEAAFILSGYRGVAIWFVPIPTMDYGADTRMFRVVELTGTRVTSLIKTELVTIPVIIIASVLFSEFIWRLGPIPSEAYPFTQEVWRLTALNSCTTYSATMTGGSKFLEAINPTVIGISATIGVFAYLLLMVCNLPTFILFGFVRGIGQISPGNILSEFAGALIGRFFFQRKFGVKRWRQTVPVVLAGFICGLGLMAMAGVGVALIAKSIETLLY